MRIFHDSYKYSALNYFLLFKIDGSSFLFPSYSYFPFLSSLCLTTHHKGMPMNQLPCLEVNGKKVNQSLACCRFIAKAINLAGNDDWENLQIDTVADTVNDFRLSM